MDFDREELNQILDRKIQLRTSLFFQKEIYPSIFAGMRLLLDTIRRGNKILACGNGGSATQSCHFAAELVNRFYQDRQAVPAISLNTDMANITSIANDMEYRNIFSRQLEALGNEGDTLLGLTTSGKSPNVLEAFATAQRMGVQTIMLTGDIKDHSNGPHIDVVLAVPATDTPLIQEYHLFILHIWAELLERSLQDGKKK